MNKGKGIIIKEKNKKQKKKGKRQKEPQVIVNDLNTASIISRGNGRRGQVNKSIDCSPASDEDDVQIMTKMSILEY